MLTNLKQLKGSRELLQRIAALEETVESLKSMLAEQPYLKAIGAAKRNTSYELGDVLFNYNDNGVNFDWFMECTQAGKTGAEYINIPADAIDGLIITDGEVEWTLTRTTLSQEEGNS